MPTTVAFKKTSAVTGNLEGQSISWQCTALVNATVTEAPHRAVPHYGFGGTYIEFASCPPPAYATVTITTSFADALGLLTILTTKTNFKPVRLHALFVDVITNEETKTVETIELLPQYITLAFDMSNPSVSNISAYGPVVERTTSTTKTISQLSFPQPEYELALTLQQTGTKNATTAATSNIENITLRANFVQDLILTSMGPYVRTYGIQAPELSVSGTTSDSALIKSINPVNNNAVLVIKSKAGKVNNIAFTVTNLSYEPLAGFKNLIRYNIQGLIT
ncbi:MAG: hypothetical protein QXE80_03355 [Pyrobaculum sp.]